MEHRLRKRLTAFQSGADEVECPGRGAHWVAGVDRRWNAVGCSRRRVVRAW